MKIYISADMEGVAGVWHADQCRKGTPEFAQARRWLTAEVAAAIMGAREGGATEVIAADMHDGSGNFLLDDLPSGVQVVEGVPHRPRFPFLDGTVDAMLLIAYHARSGTQAGVLEHTMSSAAWHYFRANGRELGEVGIDAAIAGAAGVPVALVSGDDQVCAEAAALLEGVETAQVKRGVGRHRAMSLTPRDACDLIRARAKAAMGNLGRLRPFDPGSPVEIEVRFCRASEADSAGGERVDGLTVRWQRATIADHFGGLWR